MCRCENVRMCGCENVWAESPMDFIAQGNTLG